MQFFMARTIDRVPSCPRPVKFFSSKIQLPQQNQLDPPHMRIFFLLYRWQVTITRRERGWNATRPGTKQETTRPQHAKTRAYNRREPDAGAVRATF